MLRNTAATVVGLAVGIGVNMALIVAGSALISPPAGVDVTDAASIAAGLHLFGPQHFIVPFLAHALGTFAGALAAHLLALTRPAVVAYAIGGAFLAGGALAAFMIPAPAWFIALDLLGAYLPMAWLAIVAARAFGRIAPHATRDSGER